MNNFATLNNNINNKFLEVFNSSYKGTGTIVLLCIGTDKIIGDCFGPLVGYNLKKYKNNSFYIEGDLDKIICATNIVNRINEIYKKYNNPFIIAIDSCLSHLYNEGDIIISSKGLRPGSGLNKSFNEIGDMSIKGVVGKYSKENYTNLNNVRLKTVIDMANLVSEEIKKAFV